MAADCRSRNSTDVLQNWQFSPIIDEIWYTDYDRRAEFNNHKSGSVRKKHQKLNVKKRYRFKEATLYELEVIKEQKFFIRWQKLPYSYNRR
jgi:hypothetical protein